MLGLELRLHRLQRDGYYAIAAMDHALTDGSVQGLTRWDAFVAHLDRVRASGIKGVVLNYGLLARPRPAALVTPLAGLSLIVQTYGSPTLGNERVIRHALVSVDGAVAMGADAISLQLAVDPSGINEQLERIATMAERARCLGIPTLLMLNKSSWSAPEELTHFLRAACELPVDLIKVTPGRCLEYLTPGALTNLPKPVLLGGGPHQSGFQHSATLAHSAGFTGVCLGRNLFQSNDPQGIVATLDSAFRS